MAVNLYQGADPSISAAAGRAGAALEPADLGKTFQGVASGYAYGMAHVGAAAGQVAKVATQATTAMVEEIKSIKSDDEYGEHHTKVVFDQLKGLASKGFKIFKEKKGEARKEAREDFRNQWKRSTGALKDMMKGNFMNEMLVKEDQINQNLSIDKAITQRLISAKGKPLNAPGKSYNGAYARLESSEDGKELVQRFYDKDGKPIHGFDSNGEIIYTRKSGLLRQAKLDPLTMTAKDISNLLVTKEPEALATIQAQELAAMKLGSAGLDFREGDYIRVVKEQVNTRNRFNDLTHTPIGNEQSTYAEHLSSPDNAWSEKMWASIRNLEGVKDTNDIPGIDAGDFDESDVENMRILRNEMLNYENLEARDLFTEWLVAAGEKSYNERKSIFDLNKAEQKAKSGGTEKGENRHFEQVPQPGGGTRTIYHSDMLDQVNAFKSAESQNSGQEFSGVDGELYRFNDQWEMLWKNEDNPQGDWIPADRSAVLNNLRINRKSEWLSMVGGALAVEGKAAKSTTLTEDQITGIKTVWGGAVKESSAQKTFAKILTQFPDISNEMSDEDMFSGYKFSYKGVTYDLNNSDDADKFIAALGQQEQVSEEGFAAKFN